MIPEKLEEEKEEVIEHEVSSEEIKENGLEDVLVEGDKIEIPVVEDGPLETVATPLETVETPAETPTEIETVDEDAKVYDENYRECSCGALVPLPDGSVDEPSICECGIKHIR